MLFLLIFVDKRLTEKVKITVISHFSSKNLNIISLNPFISDISNNFLADLCSKWWRIYASVHIHIFFLKVLIFINDIYIILKPS